VFIFVSSKDGTLELDLGCSQALTTVGGKQICQAWPANPAPAKRQVLRRKTQGPLGVSPLMDHSIKGGSPLYNQVFHRPPLGRLPEKADARSDSP
jgi:hypothetical protein